MDTAKDLRYVARVKKREADAKAVAAIVEEEFTKANEFLKSQGIKVKLFRSASSIQLAATLPVKFGDKPTSAKGTKQYKISHLQCFASLDGIKKAIREAIHLDELIKSGNFSWDTYLPKEKYVSPQSWQDIILLFEEHYWTTHSKTRKTLCTWEKSYCDFFKKIDLDSPINESSILKAIKTTEANTVSRNNLIRVLKALCKFVKFNYDFSSYSCPPSKIKRRERVIPSDEQIIRAWESMPDAETRWTFGMVATYGLRTEEIFINPHLDKYVDVTNTLHLFCVDADCKTGQRQVLPLKPEWVDLFDLKNPQPLKSNAKKLETIISWVNKKFRKSPYWNMGTYNLRHAYAIRGHKYGIPLADMARYMGHDTETHVKEYQRWIGMDTMIEVYLEATNSSQKSRKTLIAENKALIVDNLNLKKENENLKQKLTEFQMEIRLIKELSI